MGARLITVTVTCPDCGWPADPVMGGDHGQTCMDDAPPPPRKLPSALEIIRRHALTHPFLSINELRRDMDEAGVPQMQRGPAFGSACLAGYIKPAGHTPSTGASARRHDVKQYRSLIVNGRSTAEGDQQ